MFLCDSSARKGIVSKNGAENEKKMDVNRVDRKKCQLGVIVTVLTVCYIRQENAVNGGIL